MRHGRRYTAKDRHHALNAYISNPGYKTRNALLMSHEALVIHICTRHFGAWRDYCWQDLLQEGRIALAKAIANYRPGLSDFGGQLSERFPTRLPTRHDGARAMPRVHSKMISDPGIVGSAR